MAQLDPQSRSPVAIATGLVIVGKVEGPEAAAPDIEDCEANKGDKGEPFVADDADEGGEGDEGDEGEPFVADDADEGGEGDEGDEGDEGELFVADAANEGDEGNEGELFVVDAADEGDEGDEGRPFVVDAVTFDVDGADEAAGVVKVEVLVGIDLREVGSVADPVNISSINYVYDEVDVHFALVRGAMREL